MLKRVELGCGRQVLLAELSPNSLAFLQKEAKLGRAREGKEKGERKGGRGKGKREEEAQENSLYSEWKPRREKCEEK